MATKTTALARASCSTKEHVRAIDGSVLLEEAGNESSGELPCKHSLKTFRGEALQ